jgi:hypothetical protein
MRFLLALMAYLCSSRNCGAEALFTKPIDFGMLRAKIDTRVERAA